MFHKVKSLWKCSVKVLGRVVGYYAGFNTTVVVLESEHLEVDELVEQQVDYSTGSPMMVPHTMQYTQVIVANEINRLHHFNTIIQ